MVFSKLAIMKTVLAIYGSPRRNGNTATLLDEFVRGARDAGAEVTKLYLMDYNFKPCIECRQCDRTGRCVVKDDMQKIYPLLEESNIIILASPIFFYGVSAVAKAMIDRCQAFWARRYVLKRTVGNGADKRKGYFISTAGSKGKKLFDGAIMTMKYFCDALDVKYVGELVFRGIEHVEDLQKHPTALRDAYEAGRDIALRD